MSLQRVDMGAPCQLFPTQTQELPQTDISSQNKTKQTQDYKTSSTEANNSKEQRNSNSSNWFYDNNIIGGISSDSSNNNNYSSQSSEKRVKLCMKRNFSQMSQIFSQKPNKKKKISSLDVQILQSEETYPQPVVAHKKCLLPADHPLRSKNVITTPSDISHSFLSRSGVMIIGNNEKEMYGEKYFRSGMEQIPPNALHNLGDKKFFQRNDIIQIACGSHHTVLLDTEGKVYCFGNSKNCNKLFTCTLDSSDGAPLLLEQLSQTTLLQKRLSEHQQNKNSDDEMSDSDDANDTATEDLLSKTRRKIGPTVTFESSPFEDSKVYDKKSKKAAILQKADRIIDISMKGSHLLMITERGRAWGLRVDKKFQFEKEPQLLKYVDDSAQPRKIVMGTCGVTFTALLTEDNDLWILRNKASDVLFFDSIKAFSDISFQIGDVKKIDAGGVHVVVLSKSGQVFVFGYNHQGQLCLKKETLSVTETLLPIESRYFLENKVVDVACGFHHTVFLLSDGSVFGCGANNFNQLIHKAPETKTSPNNVLTLSNQPPGGPGVLFNIFSPCKFSNFKGNQYTKIAAGWFHTMMLTTQGTLIGTGMNDYGQLGSCEKQLLKPFETSLNEALDQSNHVVTKICCGHKHTVLLYNKISEADLMKTRLHQIQLADKFSDLNLICCQ